MKTYYFTNFPICPSCGEPIKNGKTIEIKKEKNIFFCSSCEALYSDQITLKNSNNKKIPLLYKIEVDKITQSYLDWIKDLTKNNINNGKFLITLPDDLWGKLKFISILAFEYLRRNKNKKILVISHLNEGKPSNNKMQFPDLKTFYSSLFYIDNPILGGEVRIEKKDLFLKSQVISLTIKEKGNGEIRIEKPHLNGKKKLSNKEKEEIIEEVEELTGSDRNEICIEIEGEHQKCDDYKFKVIVKFESKLLSGISGKPFYNSVNKDVISILINNDNSIKQASSEIPIIGPNDDTNRTPAIYLYSLSDNERELFHIINKINPDLIIIDYADLLIRDYWNKKDNSLIAKILETHNFVLMISINPMARVYYFKYQNNFIKKYNVIPHTWDNKLVLDEIGFEHNQDKLPQIKYIDIPELDQIDENEIKKYAKNPAYVDEIYEFFNLLKKSVDYDKLIRKNLSFTNIINDIMENKRKEVKEKVENIIGKGKENLILKKICETIKSINNDNVIIITIPRIKLPCVRDVEIMYWRDITNKKLPENTHIISTLFPSRIADLTSVREVIFIGSRKFIDTVKIILNYKLDKLSLYPIYLPSNYSLLPEPLKSILNKYKDNITFNEITQEEATEEEPEDEEEDQNEKPKYLLTKGEDALLIKDDKDSYMFIPYYTSILVQSGGTLEEHKPYEEDPNVLVGKEIIVDKNGVYFSIRRVFTKLLLMHGKTTTFKKGFYRWNNAEELIKSSTLWNRILEEAIEKYKKQLKITREEAEKEIAEILSKANLTAKEAKYIQKWWKDYIEIAEGVKIYTIEHPKKSTDIKKIYSKLREIVKDLSVYDAKLLRQSYVASTYIQKMRIAVLKGDPSEFPDFKLYDTIRKEIIYRVKNAYKVKVMEAKKVRIKRDIETFEKIRDPTPYIEV